jgi:hypothetical protein
MDSPKRKQLFSIAKLLDFDVVVFLAKDEA